MKYLKTFKINEKSEYDELFIDKTLGEIYVLIDSFDKSIYGISDIKIVYCELFNNEKEAIDYLNNEGYSIGRNQSNSPKGIKKGNYDIQKWRNLEPDEIKKLDGILVEIDKEYCVLFFTNPYIIKYNL